MSDEELAKLEELLSSTAEWRSGARINASIASAPDLVREVRRLRAQLPEGMKHCTIKFLSCPVGHGRLTATNWAPHACDRCEIERLRAIIARLTNEEEKR